MFHVPQNLIVHYHHCSIKDVGDVFIDCLNVQLFFLKNVLNCPFLHLVEEIHPFSNYGSYPYAFNTLEGNILYDTEIIDYLKNIYLFGSIEYELYFGILNELKTILIYYLWADDKIYNNFTKKIYKDRFFYLYYVYLIRKLREENLEKCKMRGLDNHSFNIKRLKTILNILDNILYDKNKSRSESDVSYFHSVCFSVLSIFYSIPLKFNMELQNVLLSKPTLIEFVKSLNDTHKVWKNEKSFLLGICNTC
ncbi:conserved Plasmodium protein, unknown function [Plasmodium malariae]|uniref:Uncharacterized protein n=2 Tax=Plasmodium malariae TaxID=5858 RepID=A0A1D3SQC7_PLAMA|nr:conserved Plasmodium protein, unknown function [Plasmodium malariae]SCO94099.1 conserved Plasmodium protein, unknown function [Plasmodium malariae]